MIPAELDGAREIVASHARLEARHTRQVDGAVRHPLAVADVLQVQAAFAASLGAHAAVSAEGLAFDDLGSAADARGARATTVGAGFTLVLDTVRAGGAGRASAAASVPQLQARNMVRTPTW